MRLHWVFDKSTYIYDHVFSFDKTSLNFGFKVFLHDGTLRNHGTKGDPICIAFTTLFPYFKMIPAFPAFPRSCLS